LFVVKCIKDDLAITQIRNLAVQVNSLVAARISNTAESQMCWLIGEYLVNKRSRSAQCYFDISIQRTTAVPVFHIMQTDRRKEREKEW